MTRRHLLKLAVMAMAASAPTLQRLAERARIRWQVRNRIELNAAIAKARAGDVIHVQSGTY